MSTLRSVAVSTAASLALISAFASCADLTLKQSVQPQFAELHSMRADLTAQWESIEQLLASVEADITALGSQSIDSEVFQSRAIADAVVERFDASMTDGMAIEAAVGAGSQLETELAGVNSATRAKVESFLTASTDIWNKLELTLQPAIQDGLKDAAGAAVKLTELTLAAEQKVATAKNNPIMTADDRDALDADAAKLELEIDQFRTFASQVAADAQTYTARLATAFSSFNGQLDAIKALN